MHRLEHLLENNRKWAEKKTRENPDYFNAMAKGQSPEFLWIGCADSRVPANEIVGLQPGELFVHRNVANLVIHSDMNSQSVIQYAVESLKVKHIIVCGHYRCGGVQAALQHGKLGLIDNWLRNIKEQYQAHKEEIESIGDEQERINRMCELNVRTQVSNVCRTPFVQEAWAVGQELWVHGWIYDLGTGLLNNLDLCIGQAETAEEIFAVDQ
ncbi:MAG: carbonic anhydrase [Balneolaceae bacterium]|nr:carbonic anhydrase [Balneolaceae bacterium]